MSVIERLFPGTSLEEFRASYWLYKPLTVSAPLSRFPEIVGNPIFNNLSTSLEMKCYEHRVDIPNQDGNNLVSHQMNANLDRAREALNKGQTIYMGGIFEQPLPDFAHKINAELDLPVFLDEYLVERFWIAFAARPSRGLRWHWDRHHIFMLQVIGKKKFRIAQNQFFSKPAVAPWGYDCWRKGMHPKLMGALNIPEITDGSLPTDCVEIELSAGDALFMPAGLWHSAETVEDSLHIGYAVKVPTLPEFLIAQLDVMHEAFASKFNVPVASNSDIKRLSEGDETREHAVLSMRRAWFLEMSQAMAKYADDKNYARFLQKMISDVERGAFSDALKELPNGDRRQ